MDVLMALLRLIHMFAGVLWVGTAFFFVLFLEPTIKAAGAEGGKFMQRLTQTRLAVTLSLASALVVVSGLVMYWVESGGLQAAWIGSGTGIALTVGGAAGILAFVVGLLVQAPATARIAAVQKEMQAAGGPPTPAQLVEIGAQQEKISQGSRWGAVLMVIALIGMAIAR
jgi:hypothetical protein